MGNIIDYAKTQLNTFNIENFNSIDSLILSQISNIILENLVSPVDKNSKSIKFSDLLRIELFPVMFDTIPYGKCINELLFYLAANPRFRDIRINYHISKTDSYSEKQFSATTFILNNTSAYIGFRGTDYSIVGWKEDFNMAFINPIPSQLDGVEYLNTIANLIPHDLYIGGHSKGGNIAVYASMNCSDIISNRIKKIFSHDGPGFRKEIIKSEAFNKIECKINKTLPSSSIIGMLLENHESYDIVKSTETGGFKQHNPFSWEIENFDFIYLEKMSNSAKYTNDTLHKWLIDVDDEKRKLFVDSLFDVLKATNSESFLEISKDWKKNIPIILNAIKNIDEEIKSILIELIKELSSLYIKNLTHHDQKNIPSFNKNLI